MNVNILYDVIDSPTGGGNQFIRTLKQDLIDRDMYSDIEAADIILFNSHHKFNEVIECKIKYPEKKFVHRVDGPMKLYNNINDNRDDIVYAMSHRIADAIIFQSSYSKSNNIDMGLELNGKPNKIIHNTASRLFVKKSEPNHCKLHLISTSVSDNWKKGYDIYQYIDKHLDFNKYSYTFIGNSPITFENIKVVSPISSKDLCDRLNDHNIFITASLKDPCSNSLLEAKACGLPCIVRNSGGHSEIITDSDIIFDDASDILKKIDYMAKNYNNLRQKTRSKPMDIVTDEYVKFFEEVLYG